jgi:hypothetical protein
MKILDSPASTILVTNSEGARYDINGSFCFVSEIDTPLEARLNIIGRADKLCRARGLWEIWKLWESRHDDRAGRAAKQLSFRDAAARGRINAASRSLR